MKLRVNETAGYRIATMLHSGAQTARKEEGV